MDPDELEPFTIDVPDAELDQLRERLSNVRWAPDAPDADWARGMPGAELRELATYWRDTYDWRAHEWALNQHPQFLTTIDDQRLHFLHVRSAVPGAVPLLITHGWPGSFVEFEKVIGPLVDPEAYGGDPADAFHVVAPSLPGYAFSEAPREPGWNINRIARTLASLMARLGYDRYAAQGGDWGSMVSRTIALVDPEHVLGVHVNMLLVRPSRSDPTELSDDERARLGEIEEFDREHSAYFALQSTRPQTLAWALTDSPVGLLAWIAEKFHYWTDRRTPVDRDQMLTNISLYWFTRTAGPSAQLYYEASHPRTRPEISAVPLGVAVFPHDIARPIRRVAEQRNNIVHWSELDRGGHFAAMEQPDVLVADIRAMFADLR